MNDSAATIATLVSTLDSSVVSRLMSKQDIRLYDMTTRALAKRALANRQGLLDSLVDIANCIPYDDLRQSACKRMGYQSSACEQNTTLRMLLGTLMVEDEIDMHVRPDVGLALHALRSLSLLHVHNDRWYQQALESREFVVQAYRNERIRSMRESRSRSYTTMDDPDERTACQAEFATFVLSITTTTMISRHSSDKRWLDFIEDAAVQIGDGMLAKLGYSGRKRDKTVQAAFKRSIRKTRVGQRPSGVLKAYLQVAISIRDVASFSTSISYAWGIHAFYDVFIQMRRDDCRSDRDLMALLRDVLEDVKAAFCAADIASTVERREMKAVRCGASLIQQETDSAHAAARRAVRRKQKKRKTRLRLLDNRAVSESGDEYADDAPTPVADGCQDSDSDASLKVFTDGCQHISDEDELDILFSTQTIDDLFAHA